MNFESTTWGPHYWFFIHTIALSYPDSPNATTKRKYYDLIQNMPLFIPEPEIGNKFSHMLDKYPVSPYLDNKESFIRWTHFIHNRFNAMLGKEEISFAEAMEQYTRKYTPPQIVFMEKLALKKYLIYTAIVFICLFFIYIYYE